MAGILLLADDSVTIQKVVKISFANDDLEVIAVDNGDDAVETARSLRPNVILADVVMPGRSGYEVCAAVRKDPDLAGIPVLLLAGTFEDFDPEYAERVGANGHLEKPFEAQTLVDRVHSLLASLPAPEAEVPASTQVGDSREDFDFGSDDLDLPLLPGEETASLTTTQEDPFPQDDDGDLLLLESELFEDDDDGPELFAELLEAEPRDEPVTPSPETQQLETDPAALAETAALDAFDSLVELEPFTESEHPELGDALGEAQRLPAVPAPPENPIAPEMEGATEAELSAQQIERLVERVLPPLREELHQSLERIAWEAFGDLSKQVVVQAVERVERIAWETVPKLAETLIQEEIRKLDRED